MRFYVGVKRDYSREVFKSASVPTETTHGALYLYAIGPFVTKRGALWGAQRGAYWYTVAQAEREAKKQARDNPVDDQQANDYSATNGDI